MQIFSNLQPLDVANQPLRLSDERTTMLTDSSVATCYNITHDSGTNLRWAKVLPPRSYLFGKTFSVFVAGRYSSCSPIDGISVAVQPSCDALSHNFTCTCTKPVPCVATRAPQAASLLICEYRCQVFDVWEFIVVYAGHAVSAPADALELCEIWFTNW